MCKLNQVQVMGCEPFAWSGILVYYKKFINLDISVIPVASANLFA
jgi:hypothetical protein